MISVNHTILHTNIVHNSSSEQIKKRAHTSRKTLIKAKQICNQIKVPEEPMTRSTGFTYCGAKLFNELPNNIKETQDIKSFKTLTKDWILEKMQPY